LSLASSFGHGFRKVRKENREPQPKGYLQAEANLACVMKGVPHKLDRRQYRTDFDYEHHGVLDHRAGGKLAE
jgi:hypothetical protein